MDAVRTLLEDSLGARPFGILFPDPVSRHNASYGGRLTRYVQVILCELPDFLGHSLR